MNEDEYLKLRVEDQIAWYDGKSQANRRAFKWLRTVEIVAAALIPLLAGFADKIPKSQLTVGLLGLIVAAICGLLSLYNLQENWTGYRTTCEALKHEKFLFLTRTDPYNIEEPFPLLVQRIESLISREHSSWGQYVRPKRDGRPHD